MVEVTTLTDLTKQTCLDAAHAGEGPVKGTQSHAERHIKSLLITRQNCLTVSMFFKGWPHVPHILYHMKQPDQ